MCAESHHQFATPNIVVIPHTCYDNVMANSVSIDWRMLATHHFHNYHTHMLTSPL